MISRKSGERPDASRRAFLRQTAAMGTAIALGGLADMRIAEAKENRKPVNRRNRIHAPASGAFRTGTVNAAVRRLGQEAIDHACV